MSNTIFELFNLVEFVFFRGGWVLFAAALVYMFYRLYMDRIQIGYYERQEWVFLKITVPEENEKSPITFEHVFNQLHSTQASITFAEKYLEGKFQIWFTWEITSIGGRIGNYVHIATKHRDTLEAAIYSQYPEAEITETEDYFEHLPKYDPDTSDFDIFAWSNILKKPDPYPIRTYIDFEHASQDTFVDPVTGIWEALTDLSPYEFFTVQYIFQPVTDDWKESGYQLIRKLKGEPEKKGGIFLEDFLGQLLTPLFDLFIGSSPEQEQRRQKPTEKEEPPSMMLHLTEGEKDIINAVDRNLSKLGYATKIRCMYLAPKEKYDYSPVVTAVIGGFKSLGATNLNSIKPDTKHWTRVNYMFFENREKKLNEFRLKWRKRKHWSMIKNRSFFEGRPPNVLNTEEIATLLHFPDTEVTVPQIEKVPVTKVQAPPELPIAPEFKQN